MPQVGNKKFPYTPSGIAQANQAMGRKRNIRQVVGAGNQRFTAQPANQRRPLPVKGPMKNNPMIPGRNPNRRTY